MGEIKYILADFEEWETLRPLTLSRAVADCRVGILTIKEKWEKWLNQETGVLTQPYLQDLYHLPSGDDFIYINASVIPNEQLVEDILTLKENHTLISESGKPIASFAEKVFSKPNHPVEGPIFVTKTIFDQIRYAWDIFTLNGKYIQEDIHLMAIDPNGGSLSFSNSVYEPDNIYIEEGAVVESAILNAKHGPIFIGKGAEIMEGAIIRGPFALCEGSTVKMGAKIYGDTTIGPHCKVGGEVSNSVFFGYANKAHDGFLGNSVIGEWCNLGADTNNSNLKNNYSLVTAFEYTKNDMLNTQLQFCGLIMGDHAKSGINTMFNTGTIVGFSANVFGGGFPDKHIPSFSWGGTDEYHLDKAIEVAEKVMERRKIPLTSIQRQIFTAIFEQTKIHRNHINNII